MAKVFGPAINIDGAVNYEVFQTEEQLTQQMKILRDAGFTYVDISYEGLVYQYSKEWEENFLRALDNTGLIPYQSHALFLNAIVREGDHLRMNLSPEQKTALERMFQVAGRRGTKLMIFHPQFLYPDLWGDEWLAEHLRVNVEFFEWMGRLAKPHGIRIAVETMANLGLYRHYCTRIEELEELVDTRREKDPEVFGICVDTGHLHFAGYAPHEVVRRIGKKIIAFHIQDNYTCTDQHNLPPFGTIDWNAFIDAVREVGFEGPLTFECQGGHLRKQPPEWKLPYFTYAKSIGDVFVQKINA